MSVKAVNGFVNLSQFAQEKAVKPIPCIEVPGLGTIPIELPEETSETPVKYGTLDFEKSDFVKKAKFIKPAPQANQEPEEHEAELVFRWKMSAEGTYYKK